MNLFQSLTLLLTVVATVDAFYDYHNDPGKKEHLDMLRSRLQNLQTGSHLNGKNVVNKQHGSDSRVFRADDLLTSIQRDEAGSAQDGINKLLQISRKLSTSYDEQDDEL